MKKLFFVFVILQVVMSCSKKSDDTPAPYLNVKQPTVSLLPYLNASADVIVESNIDWQVSVSTNDWLQLSKTSGNGNDTIHVTVKNNNSSGQARSATITITPSGTSTDLQAQVTVEQKPFTVQLAYKKAFGGTGGDYINALVPLADGGLLLAGTTGSYKTGEVGATHGANDFWVVRLNSNRDTVWTRTLGGSSFEDGAAACATTDGGFVIAGRTFSSQSGDVSGINHGNGDWWVVKLKSNGDTAWTRVLGGTTNDFAYGVASTADGGIVVVGETLTASRETDVMAVKFTSSGNIVWQKTMGGTGIEHASSVAVTNDGAILIAGETSSSNSGDIGTNHGSADFWVIKLNGNGDIIWSKLYGGSDAEQAYAIAATPDGGCIVAGTSTSSQNQDVVGKNHSLSSAGSTDWWIVKLNASGSITWSNLLGGSDWDQCNAVTVTPDGGYAAAGYAGNNDGDVEQTHGQYDYWVVKFSNTGTKLWSKAFGSSQMELATSIAANPDNSLYVGGYIYNSQVNGDVTETHGYDEGWLIKITDN